MQSGSSEELIRALRESGLHDEQRSADIEREVAPLGGDAQAVVRHLVAHGHATVYQIKKVVHGRAADLFIGPYVVLDKLGEGGMGKVYKVETWRRPDRQMALKVVRAPLLTNPVIRRRFELEVHAATALKHPNIVGVLDSGEYDGRHFLAMDFVNGIDLARLVRDYETLLVPEACEYARQAALGLHFAHRNGFVHRDVKPSNILVSGERHVPEAAARAVVKVSDLGLVLAVEFESDPERCDLTKDGTAVGTPDYMSPEQARNSRTVDPRADVYSLGCTLFFLLTGRPPYPEGSPIEKIFKHQLEPAPPVRDLRPDAPEPLNRLIARLMSKTPEGRPPDAATVAALLEPFTRYDFGWSRGYNIGDGGFQLPTAPSEGRGPGGYYSMADESRTGEPNQAVPQPGSSVFGIPTAGSTDDAFPPPGDHHTPTNVGPATGKLPRRAVAVAERARPKSSLKGKPHGSRRRRKRKARARLMAYAYAGGLAALATALWLVLRRP